MCLRKKRAAGGAGYERTRRVSVGGELCCLICVVSLLYSTNMNMD